MRKRKISIQPNRFRLSDELVIPCREFSFDEGTCFYGNLCYSANQKHTCPHFSSFSLTIVKQKQNFFYAQRNFKPPLKQDAQPPSVHA